MLRSHALGGVWQAVEEDEENSTMSTTHEGKATA
jgi:hypothetical protein